MARALIVSASPVVRAGLPALIADRLEIAVLRRESAEAVATAAAGCRCHSSSIWHGDCGQDSLDLDGPCRSSPCSTTFNLPRAARLCASGVRGIAPRDLSADELVAATQAVAAGWIVLPPESRELDSSASADPPPNPARRSSDSRAKSKCFACWPKVPAIKRSPGNWIFPSTPSNSTSIPFFRRWAREAAPKLSCSACAGA